MDIQQHRCELDESYLLFETVGLLFGTVEHYHLLGRRDEAGGGCERWKHMDLH
jgi:hypothetical protein